MRNVLTRPRLIGLVAAAAVPGAVLLAAPPSASAVPVPRTAALRAPAPDKTSPLEAKRVDSVPTPKLAWYSCYGDFQCATAKLPLDYDRPGGAKVEVAILRHKARDAKHRIGSLFLNPGGPGGSGTQLAQAGPSFLSPTLVDRFDLVGFDPRGIAYSDNVKCFPNSGAQAEALAGLAVAFPYTKAEKKAYIASAKAEGRACSTTGLPLAASMSTAEVARDMDVLRRAVGDAKLSYLGFSYGTALGQYYANLFPDRVRALTIDGVLDPTTWTGTRKTANVPITTRVRSAEASWRALHEILVRCDRAGGRLCSFAPGDPVKNFDLIAKRLQKAPLVVTDPGTGNTFTVSYAEFVATLTGFLYSDTGYQDVADFLSQLIVLTEPPASSTPAVRARRAAAVRGLVKDVTKARSTGDRRYDFPYDNGLDAFSAVTCVDSWPNNPARAEQWDAAAKAADKRAPHFGLYWTWGSAQCATSTWRAHDEDAYRGPFTRRTSAPVLVVGDYWDPATNYANAVHASQLLPNSRLLSSNSWGHTAYGRTACVTAGVDAYLLSLKLPAKGTVCTDGIQPFESPAPQAQAVAPRGLPTSGTGRVLPPVVPLLPQHR